MKLSPFIVVLTLLLFPARFLEGKTLHAILVADTIHDISKMTQAELARWQSELKFISKNTQMILRERAFFGENFKKELVQDYVQELNLESEDAVVFVFSGHGYRTKEKKTHWPFLVFEFYEHGIDLKWVAETIKEKKPKFALILSDCCNNYLERGFTNESKMIHVNLPLRPVNPTGYEKLFSKAKGCILISSCSPGQFSYGSRFGGIYTQCFFASLNRELAEASPSWKNLLLRANGYIDSVQKPVCEIFR